jgi:hypothetical protein
MAFVCVSVSVSVSVCVCVFAHRLVHTGKRPRRSSWYLSGCVGVCLRAHSLVFVCMQENGRAGVDGGAGSLLSVVYCIEGIARAHTHTNDTHQRCALYYPCCALSRFAYSHPSQAQARTHQPPLLLIHVILTCVSVCWWACVWVYGCVVGRGKNSC